jgi:hypothetical protein
VANQVLCKTRTIACLLKRGKSGAIQDTRTIACLLERGKSGAMQDTRTKKEKKRMLVFMSLKSFHLEEIKNALLRAVRDAVQEL